MLSSNVPFAIGSLYVQKYFKASTKATAVEMFNGIKGEFVTLLKQAEWIDESTREKLLSKLKSLVPLLAMPDGGFNERSINEFYDDIKLDKNQYLRTLFQLRVIDADNKFRQTYTSTALGSSSEWKKYLPPTSIAAVYSQSDNTIRKRLPRRKLVNRKCCHKFLTYSLSQDFRLACCKMKFTKIQQ